MKVCCGIVALLVAWLAMGPKSTGAIEGVAQAQSGIKSKEDRIALGKPLYVSCTACHQPEGQGVPPVFPPLARSDFLNADKKRTIQIVTQGWHGEMVVNGVKYNTNMPSIRLTDEEVANVLTYVYGSFGNSGLLVTPEEVKSQRGW